jgi:hypothetical protein
MIANGSIVTNAVFERSVAAMFKPTNTASEMYNAIAYNVPAVSHASGLVNVFQEGSSNNLDSEDYRDGGWGRSDAAYGNQWLHSDIKDMAYRYVYSLFDEIVFKEGDY